MILLSHPTANAFNRPLAEALHQAGRLAAFHTTLAFGRRRIAFVEAPGGIRLELMEQLAP